MDLGSSWKRGWKFLHVFEIPQCVSTVELGIYTETSNPWGIILKHQAFAQSRSSNCTWVYFHSNESTNSTKLAYGITIWPWLFRNGVLSHTFTWESGVFRLDSSTCSCDNRCCSGIEPGDFGGGDLFPGMGTGLPIPPLAGESGACRGSRGSPPWWWGGGCCCGCGDILDCGVCGVGGGPLKCWLLCWWWLRLGLGITGGGIPWMSSSIEENMQAHAKQTSISINQWQSMQHTIIIYCLTSL